MDWNTGYITICKLWCEFTVYYNRNRKQLLCVYIHVHACGLMKTQKIEKTLLGLYREHSK